MSVSKPLVSIIIVNYNTGEELILCIKSIRKYLINITYEILLVDNNSTDNSRELVEQNFTDIQCDIYLDKIWKMNEKFYGKWKVKCIHLL